MSGARVLILVVDDVEIAIDMMIALEGAGHRVDHVFHVDEAMLRVRMDTVDALVVAAPRIDAGLATGWCDAHGRTALVLVAPSAEGRAVAETQGIPVLDRPVDPDALVRVVERSLARKRSTLSPSARASIAPLPSRRRTTSPPRPSPPPPPSRTRARLLRLVVLVRRSLVRELEPELLGVEVDAICAIAGDAHSAAEHLAGHVDALLVEGSLLLDPAAGIVLRQQAWAKNVPVISFSLAANADGLECARAIRQSVAELRDRERVAAGDD